MTKRWSVILKILAYVMITSFILHIVCKINTAMAQPAPPPGTEETTTRKTLRIAVPGEKGLSSAFISFRRDPTNGETHFDGFSIEMFKTVMNKAMPYQVSYELVPYTKPDGTMNGTYDDMLRAVSNGV